jgi:uncharacterized membrane protein
MHFCNRTSDDIYIAVHHNENDEWVTEGWWRARPGDCTTPLGVITTRYVYYYAYSNGGDSTWPNSTDRNWLRKCVSRDEFRFYGTRTCDRIRDFGAVDTGDYTEYTMRLGSDSGGSRPQLLDDNQ